MHGNRDRLHGPLVADGDAGRSPIAGREPLPDALRARLNLLGPLPMLSTSARRLIALADDPEAEVAEIVQVVEGDGGLCANLLRAANAAGAGRATTTSAIGDAVTTIGRVRLREVAMEGATFGLLERTPGIGAGLRAELHAHALAVARLAAGLAEASGNDPNAAHLAGLLHDIGKVVLPMVFGEPALALVGAGPAHGAERVERERGRLGVDHAAAGAAIAEAWNLPDAIVAAIRRHHDPPGQAGIAGCVQAANELARVLAGHRVDPAVLATSTRALALDPEALDEVIDAAEAGFRGRAMMRERMLELQRRADEDELTGVASRRCWKERVSALAASAAAGALLIIDVDHFKEVNDEQGHLTGDRLLRTIAGLIAERGVAGRLGGDEFGLWLDVDGDAALATAEDLCAAVAAATPSVAGGRSVGVSIGLASVPADGRDLTALLATADEALYAAKRAGRSRASAPAAAGGPGAAHPVRAVSAGDALRVVLDGHLRSAGVVERARDPGEGARALAAATEVVADLCRSAVAVDLMLGECARPRALEHAFESLALAGITGCRLGLDAGALQDLVAAALLADIGMARLPAGLRDKPSRLTRAERAVVETHPALGAAMLAPIADRWPLAPIVARQHHERWDGDGYPARLRGAEIATEAQVVALCHRYLAAVEARPHRPGLAPHVAFELLLTLSERLVGPDVLEAFAASIAIYPLGAPVRLSTGLGGTVAPGGHPTRPRVRILWDAAGDPVGQARTVSLADAPTVFIEAVGRPSAEGGAGPA